MKFKAFLLLALAALSPAAFAAGSWTGVTVSTIIPLSSEYFVNGTATAVQVVLSASASGTPPACSSSNRTYVVIDVSTPGGAFAAAVFQSARLSGTTLTVVGMGNCNFESGIETLAYVEE